MAFFAHHYADHNHGYEAGIRQRTPPGNTRKDWDTYYTKQIDHDAPGHLYARDNKKASGHIKQPEAFYS